VEDPVVDGDAELEAAATALRERAGARP